MNGTLINRFQGRRFVPAAVGVWMIAIPLVYSPVLCQEKEEDLLTRIRELRIVLNMGEVGFEELDFPRAVRDLSRILEPFAAGQLGYLSSEEVDLLARALELRGRAYFNLGDPEKAERDFEQLIRLKVGYQLDRQKISPKVIDRWVGVRARMVSTALIQVHPIGAEVLVDDQVIGLGPRCEKDLLAGQHRLTVRHPGYQTYRDSIQVNPGEILSRTVTLVRNSRDVRLVTVPAGVQVFIDDRLVGVTSGMASPAYEAVARKLSFPREEASSPLLVKHLQPGVHEIRFERECYLSSSVRVEVRLDPESEEPQEFRPVVLEPSQGTLSVRTPPGGRVFLDGEPMGKAPMEITGICSGPHRVEVRGIGDTRWFEDIAMGRQETLEIDADPRPTLAFLGIYASGPEGEVYRVEEESRVEEGLREISAYNLIPGKGAPIPSPEISFLRARITEILSRAPGSELWTKTGPVDGTILRRARENLRADLLLLGTVPPQGLDDEVVFFLFETGLRTPDRMELADLGSQPEWKLFLDRLSRPVELYGPWFGATSVDTLLSTAPVVVRVSPGSPAAEVGILPGDEILRGGNRSVGTNRDLLEILEAVEPGGSLKIEVRREESLLEKSVRLSRTPLLLAENRPGLFYSKLVAELHLRSLVSSSREERNLVLLNLALAYIHFGEYEKAIEVALRKIDLPRGSGISYGTVQYYLGVCYRHLGREERAREAFRRAAGEEKSTLGSNDGPLVALRAERLLRNLP